MDDSATNQTRFTESAGSIARDAGQPGKLANKRETLEVKKQKLLDLCLDGIIDKNEFVDRKESIENEITRVVQSMAE